MPTAAGDGRVLDRRALILAAVAISVGAIGLGLSTLLSHNDHLEPATLIRYSIVITLGVYAVVAALVVTQITPSVRLRWTSGSPYSGAALGIAVGGGASLLLLAVVSAAAGKLSPDPRAVLIMSEGDAGHILAALLIFCVAAPLVEEVLFRGILLESLRPRGAALALMVSAAAFAVWHLNPAALRYYALLGIALGFLYSKRGLVCSVAAHLGFNGVLTVAAIVVVLSPGTTVHAGQLTLKLPSGWHRVDNPSSVALLSGSAVSAEGPSGSAMIVVPLATPAAPDIGALENRIGDGSLGYAGPGVMLDQSSLRSADLRIGEAVEVDLHAQGHAGTLVIIPHDGESYEVIFLSAGSAKAGRDFDRMLSSVRLG